MHIFGFDFSMAKPAMCYYNTYTDTIEFYCWPMSADTKTINILTSADVHVIDRKLPTVSKKNFEDSNSLVREHTKRAAELSELILSTIKQILLKNSCTSTEDVYVASEGLSFASTGNAALDLSGYKYSLLTTLYKYGITNIYTYSPISIKSVAGFKKVSEYSKDFMINAIKETSPKKHKFIHTICYNEQALKKSTAFVKCVDDIVDSYWVTRTFCEKENIRHNLV